MLAPWKESYDKSKQLIKKQRQRSLCWQRSVWISYGFSSNHVWMWELDHKEGLEQKNWCFQTVVLEKTLESPLDSKEIKSVNPKGNRPWIFIGRTDAEAPILWPPNAKGWVTGKRPWCWKRLRTTGEGGDRGWDGSMASPTRRMWVWASSGSWWWQESLACCSSWGRKELDTNKPLNWTKKNYLKSPPFVMSPNASNKYHLSPNCKVKDKEQQ